MKMYNGTSDTRTTIGMVTGYGRVNDCATVLQRKATSSADLVNGLLVKVMR